ncbi:hypothetical protein TNCV_3988561 [Trichonephila clavipes]|nr:hypothetical protein TNCV_3988561 [Trichonephila clavipes]
MTHVIESVDGAEGCGGLNSMLCAYGTEGCGFCPPEMCHISALIACFQTSYWILDGKQLGPSEGDALFDFVSLF